MKMPKSSELRAKLLATAVCAALGGAFLPATAVAQDAEMIKRIDALQKEIDALKAQVQKVEKEAKAPPAPAAGAPLAQKEVESWRKYFANTPTGNAPATSARTGIQIYGRIDMGYESNNDGTVSRTVLNNYSSRIGFKGTRVFSDDLTGIMQIETGVAPDDNANSGTWASRESYFGLRSKSLGTIKAGRHDSPFKDVEGESAPMLGSGDAMEVIISGKGTGRAVGATWTNFYTRYPNVAQYETPMFGNFQVKAAYSTDEVNGATGTVRKPSWATSGEYDDGTWYAGAAWQEWSNFNGAGVDATGLKLAASVDMKSFTLGAQYSKLDNGIDRKTDNWMVTGTYKLGPTILKGSYAESSESKGGADDGIKMWGIELGYPLDKHTTVYGYYTKITNDTNARARFEKGDNAYTPAAGKDPSLAVIALQYNF
jgi:predicted porin